MDKKIELDKNRLIVFLGTMNAMPMMYAWELKKLGYKVLYFVDRPQSDTLSRPENHFPEISYPYPDWIIEFPLRTQMALPYLQKFYANKIKQVTRKVCKDAVQLYVLNGLFFSLAEFLEKDAKKIALAHGSDVDSWADVEGIPGLVKSFHRKSIFKFLPFFVSEKLISLAVRKQYRGISHSDAIAYFPRGFNKSGDRVLDNLVRDGVRCLERYDVSFEPLKTESREFKKAGKNLVIFSGVRFMFKTFSEGNDGYAKGNDLIIDGLARFYKENPSIEVHFVEKGPDVDEAKRLCAANGLAPVVTWHKEMKFKQLLALYAKSDICFDQVGEHWIGAIGCYALWLGKPLIANDELAVRCGVWPENNPICSARNSDEVYMELKRLSSSLTRKEISLKSIIFADEYLSPANFLKNAFTFF